MKKNLKSWIEITKPRITIMQLFSVSLGYFSHSNFNLGTVDYILLLFGTVLASAAACMINHCLEVKEDALMYRTKDRPLVKKILKIPEVLLVALVIIFVSTYLLLKVSYITAFISLLTIFIYLCIYTPLKKVSWLNTFVGSIPGFLPILGGWFAYGHSFSVEVLYLILIMFLWQFPHFFVLSFLYEDDYKNAGFKMLSAEIGSEFKIKRQTILYLMLLTISVYIPFVFKYHGFVYLFIISMINYFLLKKAFLFVKYYSKESARSFFVFTILFIPIWFFAVLVDSFF